MNPINTTRIVPVADAENQFLLLAHTLPGFLRPDADASTCFEEYGYCYTYDDDEHLHAVMALTRSRLGDFHRTHPSAYSLSPVAGENMHEIDVTHVMLVTLEVPDAVLEECQRYVLQQAMYLSAEDYLFREMELVEWIDPDYVYDLNAELALAERNAHDSE